MMVQLHHDRPGGAKKSCLTPHAMNRSHGSRWVELTNMIGQRALTYVAAVANQGYELSYTEFERYVSMPIPELRAPWGASSRALEVADPPADAEPVLDWLVRLGWLSRHDGTVGITPLGRAVLRAIEQRELTTELPPEVTLGPAEPFQYEPVLGRMANLRDALLVDPTFSFDSLLDVMVRTSVTRILIDADAAAEDERRRLAAALARPLGIDRPLFIGVSSELSDRFIIPAAGPIGFLATSRNLLGQRHSMLGLIQPPVADSLRKVFEDVWSRATPLGAEPQAPAPRRQSFPPPRSFELPGEPEPQRPAAPAAPDAQAAPAQAKSEPAGRLREEPRPAPEAPPAPPAREEQGAPAAVGAAPSPFTPSRPSSAVTALRSLVTPMENGPAAAPRTAAGGDDERTRPAPPPLRSVGEAQRPFGDQSEQPRPFSDVPRPFGDQPRAGYTDVPPPSDNPREPNPVAPPAWNPPNPWTPPARLEAPPFQRRDDGPTTQAWTADEADD
jgi:hypothetical protein